MGQLNVKNIRIQRWIKMISLNQYFNYEKNSIDFNFNDDDPIRL